jgi:hypothetical protein
MRTGVKKVVLCLALMAVIIPSVGCRRSRGNYTSVDFGFGCLPDFLSGGGYEDVYIDEGYYDGGFYDDGGYFDDGGYYETGFEDEYYYDDGWKTKRVDATRR